MTTRPHDCTLCRWGVKPAAITHCTHRAPTPETIDALEMWLNAHGAVPDDEGLPVGAPRCPAYAARP